jgi:hypothetical protein
MTSMRFLTMLPLATAVLLGEILIPACHHRESQEAAPSAAPDPGKVPQAGKPDYHEETFDLAMRQVGALTAGTAGSVEIQLLAKGGYHCNDKYPYKFRVDESEGIKFSAPVFTKEALTLEEMRATMKLDLTPETKGEKSIRGVFAFSLCSAERCLVEKRELETKIAVN